MFASYFCYYFVEHESHAISSHVAHQLQLQLLVACISHSYTSKLHVGNANKIKYKNIASHTTVVVRERERRKHKKSVSRESRKFRRKEILKRTGRDNTIVTCKRFNYQTARSLKLECH